MEKKVLKIKKTFSIDPRNFDKLNDYADELGVSVSAAINILISQLHLE